MGRKSNGMKQQNIPLPVVGVAVVLVVAIIAANILIVRSASYALTRKYLLGQLDSIVDGLEYNVEKLKDKTEIVETSAPDSRNPKVISEYLSGLKSTSFLYNFYYMDMNGTLMDEDGCIISDEEHRFSEVVNIRSNLYQDDFYAYCERLEKHGADPSEKAICHVHSGVAVRLDSFFRPDFSALHICHRRQGQ